MFSLSKVFGLAAVTLTLGTSSVATPWTIETSHTRVGFSVRHFFTPVIGQFDRYDVTLDWDRATPANSRVEAHIQVGSVNSGNAKRDEHLRTPDWFDAATQKEIVFRSTAVRAVSANAYVATGDLTIKGITKRVDMPITLLGVKDVPAEMQGMLGGAKRIASFEGKLSIDRRMFGVGTGMWAETAIVGSDVEITLQLEASEK